MIVLVTALLITSLSLLAREKAGRKDTVQHPTIYTCPKEIPCWYEA